MVHFSRLAIAALLVLMPAAALGQAKPGNAQNDYTPSEQALAGIPVPQAQQTLNTILPGWYVGRVDHMYPIAHLKVGLTRIDIVDGEGTASSVALDNADIVVTFATFFDPDHITINDTGLSPPNDNKAETTAVANAFYVLRQAAHADGAPAGDSAFAAVVSAYRAAQPKPQLPEDARRYEVQAKGAIQDGDFAGAAAYYAQGLQIAPWWPGGHFNRAAVLAEIGEYQLAIAEMQRYLLLAPDAPDARASQDKIYDWERQLNKATSAPLPASSQAKPYL